MSRLYEHAAKDPEFIALKDKFKEPLQLFHDFAEQQTIEANNSKKGSSKAHSYQRFLIRYILLYQDIFQKDIQELNTFDTLNKIELINKLPDFNAFNRRRYHFFSATFTCFKEFLIHLVSTSEDQSDIEFQTKINNIKNIDDKKSPSQYYKNSSTTS